MKHLILAAIVAVALGLGALATPAAAHDPVGNGWGCPPWWEWQIGVQQSVWIEGHYYWTTVWVPAWNQYYSYQAWMPGFYWYPQPSGGQWVYHHHPLGPECGFSGTP